MKARRVSKGQTLQQQVRYTGPTQPVSSMSQTESESQSLFALTSSSLAATVLHRHPLGKLVRLRETYAGSNVEPAATIARRIRTALDLLANEQWKRCTQECDKLLKKHPNFLCATVLRSMALFRTSPEHAVELVRSESEHTPIIDPLTLMCFVYFWMYQAQDAKIVVKTISEYLTNKACYKDSDTYSAIMFVYLRYGMYKHFQQIAWTMHSQERSNRSFKSVLLSLLLMVEVCDTSGPDALEVMPTTVSPSLNDKDISTVKQDTKNRSVDCVARLGVKFMEKKIDDDKLLQNHNAVGPLFDTYLIFLNKCSNFKGMLDLVNRMLAAAPPLQNQDSSDSDVGPKPVHDRLHAVKYGFARAEVFKLMGRYAEALEQYRSTMLSINELVDDSTKSSYINRTAASLFPHEAKESIAECIYRLYFNALNPRNEPSLFAKNADDVKTLGSVAEITTLSEAVIDAVGQHPTRKADAVMTKAKIISHLLALIDLHRGDAANTGAAGKNSIDFAAIYAAIPFISRDEIMHCVQDMYRFTPRDSPAFYDCARHLMRYFDDNRLHDQWTHFVAAENDESLLFNVKTGTRITSNNENEILNDRNAAWYRQIAVKIVIDEFLSDVLEDATQKKRQMNDNSESRNGIHERNGDGKQGDLVDVLGQVETLLRLFVRARAGEAADQGTGPPHNSEDFGVLAVIKLYQYALRKSDNSMIWLCTLIAAELAKPITLQQPAAAMEAGENSSELTEPKPTKMVDSTQVLFQFILMNIMIRFGAMPAALEIFQSGMRVKNLQLHRFGYYLSSAATFLMPGTSGMFVSSHLCEYISLSITEANRFVEQAINAGNMHASIADVLECAHHLPTLQNSLLGRSLTLHTIWQLFFMQIPQALGPCGILKRFEAYKEDLSNCLLTEVNYRNELTALNTVPTYAVDDVRDDAKRQFLRTLLRNQTIFGQMFDLFAVAFSMAFYMRQNSSDDNDADTNNNVGGGNDGDGKRGGKTIDNTPSSSGGITQAQLMRERVHVAYYDDMREQFIRRLSELPDDSGAAAQMPESTTYFENHLTFPYSDPLVTVHSMGIFNAFIHACDIAKCLRSVLLRADIIVTSSQLASRLGNNTSAEVDTAELSTVLDELRAVVQKTVNDLSVCLNTWSQKHAAVFLPVGAAVESDSDNNIMMLLCSNTMSPFWFRRFVEDVTGVVWLVQALRLFAHRYSTVLRVSANPIKAMLMAHNPSSSATDIAAGGDVVAAAAAAPSGIVQQLFGAAAAAQKPHNTNNKPQQQQSGGRRGGSSSKQRGQQNRTGALSSGNEPSTLQTAYNTLEQLLAPAISTLDTFAGDVERGAQELLQIFSRIPFVAGGGTAAVPSLFGEPQFQSSGNNFFPPEWERFQFVFAAVAPNEAKELHESTRRRILSSWTKVMDELVSVLRDKGAPIGSDTSGKSAAQYQDMQTNWL